MDATTMTALSQDEGCFIVSIRKSGRGESQREGIE